MDKNIKVKQLTSDDHKDWRGIRLRALCDDPLAFGQTYSEMLSTNDMKLKQELTNNLIFIAYHNKKPIGCLGFERNSLKKLSHRGQLYSMFILNEYRGLGIGSILLTNAIESVKDKVSHLCLAVTASNREVIKFYKKNHFNIYGAMPCGMYEDGKCFDIILMYRKL